MKPLAHIPWKGLGLEGNPERIRQHLYSPHRFEQGL